MQNEGKGANTGLRTDPGPASTITKRNHRITSMQVTKRNQRITSMQAAKTAGTAKTLALNGNGATSTAMAQPINRSKATPDEGTDNAKDLEANMQHANDISNSDMHSTGEAAEARLQR